MTNDSYEFWREIKKEQVMEKIEGTSENWDNQVLGADERYAKRVSPEQQQELDMIVKSWFNPDDEELLEQLYATSLTAWEHAEAEPGFMTNRHLRRKNLVV